MQMTLTLEQEAIRDMARRLATEEIAPKARQIDETSTFDRALHKRLGELGLLGMTAPPEYGGSGSDTVTWCMVVEEIAKASSAVANGLTLTESMVHYLIAMGSEEQKMKYLPRLASGESLCSFCLTEPNAGSDAASLSTTATIEGDDVILNGQKMWISGALVADFFIVVASIDKAQRSKGIRTYIVERGTPGLSFGEKLDLMGIRGFGTAPVFFDNCRIPKSQQLGGEEGFRAVMHGLDGAGRLGAAAMAVGVAQAAMDVALKYSLEREQFRQPVFDFQSVQFMLADMAIEIEAARLLMHKAAALRDENQPFTFATSLAKTFAGDMCMRNVTNAMQVFGGYSYSKEYPIERLFRDAKIHQIWDGTNQVQRMIIARHLKKEAA
ncbi:acyl-CoA dehydrogenase family protein [Sinorhizobium chiapasense]|uniref:Acyl-CoA dehydrogenase family protein n=1 Tax=Sinorhizobium chiapasense TaxID=501572 RepID=A0ABZ2BKY6_9HYPH